MDRLEWLAGILEGEGSFLSGPPSRPRAPAIVVGMSDLDVVQRVAKLLGVNFVNVTERLPHKTMYKTAVTGSRAVELMRLLHPLMGERRGRQIEKAIASYSKWEPTWRVTGRKVCTRCRVDRGVEDFYVRVETGGPRSHCRECSYEKYEKRVRP